MMTPLKVAVAAIVNHNNEVLVSKRRQNVDQGGLWEFPGGKVEPGETIGQALHREIAEELALIIHSPRPLITLQHDYPDKTVHLSVYRVDSFSYKAGIDSTATIGAEGQRLKWQPVHTLNSSDFPAADKTIITALQLPPLYLISGKFISLNDFNIRLSTAINQGIKLLQLRLKIQWIKHNRDLAAEIIKSASALCVKEKVVLMLNIPDEYLREIIQKQQLVFSGIHFDSYRLHQLDADSVQAYRQHYRLAASCHTQQDINRAERLELDFIVLSPLRPTTSHPQAKPLGWRVFAEQISTTSLPVYALGGVGRADLSTAWQAGAQGVAGIRFQWENRVE